MIHNSWKCEGMARSALVTKGQLISKCLYEIIVWTKIPTKILIVSALALSGQKLSNFLLVFWSKRRLQKDILKLTDLYQFIFKIITYVPVCLAVVLNRFLLADQRYTTTLIWFAILNFNFKQSLAFILSEQNEWDVVWPFIFSQPILILF